MHAKKHHFVNKLKLTMKLIPQAAIVHKIIKKKVPRRGQGVPLKADQIPMFDAPYCLQLCLKLLQALGIVRVKPLNSHWPAIFKDAFVNSA